MLKTLQTANKQEREAFAVPRSVQEAIPIRRIWPDGIFLCGQKYTKSFRFSDINYSVASKEDKTGMFLDYSELLNALDSGASAKITIRNRRLDRAELERSVLYKMDGSRLDRYRQECNDWILNTLTGANNVTQERIITFAAVKKNIQDAANYFNRVGADLAAHLSALSSRCEELDAAERLRILHDFFRPGEEPDFRFDLRETMRKGHDFRDYICPDSLEFMSDHFKFGNQFGRVLYLREYANYLKDSFIAELCELPRSLMLSIDILPIPTDEAVREIESRLLGVETNITNWQRRQNANNNFSAVVPYDMEMQRKEAREFLDDLTGRDQRMMFVTVTLVHLADSYKQLNADTDTLLSTARKNLCQMGVAKFQQKDGLDTVLPYGLRRIDALRTLTTESTAVLMPFRAQEINEPGGVFYGLNAVSHNPLLGDRAKLLNPNGFYLGVPGSGKSMMAKEEIISFALGTEDEILVCDPENEYIPLVKSLGGSAIRVAPGSPDHINPMDMSAAYSDNKNPIIDKSEFVLSLFEQLVGERYELGPKDKSILDRCVASVYRNYQAGGPLPRLSVLREVLLAQEEPEAKDLALASELVTTGSLNTFSYETNVDMDNRITCFAIRDLGRQLKALGLLIITEFMLNRVACNWSRGVRTHIFIDELHVMYEHPYTAAWFGNAWKRFRKRNAFATGLTQNISYMLKSSDACELISNSEFVVMLNQAAPDRERLAELLNISDLQLGYITNAAAGHGLLRYGSSIVPFINEFPKHTELYKLMTTKPGE